MSLTAIPAGQIGCVVTSLEMLVRPTPKPMPPSSLRLVPWKQSTPEKYRALFARVGAPWLWFSRLALDEARLLAIIHDPAIAIYAVEDKAGIEVGMLELDFRASGECELSYLGLVPELAGKGHGRWLMAHTLALAWAKGITRVWVHTCTLDHPAALGFYRRAGFMPFARSFEIFTDPRVAGHLPRDAAPQTPLLEGTGG